MIGIMVEVEPCGKWIVLVQLRSGFKGVEVGVLVGGIQLSEQGDEAVRKFFSEVCFK